MVIMDDLQTWKARIGLYCARLHRTHRGPSKSFGPNTYSTHVHGRKSISDGASRGALLAMSLLSIAIAMFSLLTVAGDIELNPGPGMNSGSNDPLEGMTMNYVNEVSILSSFYNINICSSIECLTSA